MKILVDTNVLLRLNDKATTESPAKPAIMAVHKAGHELFLVPR